MAKYLRYYTTFWSLAGHVIRAELLQEAAEAFVPVEIGIGAGASPLVLEWAETDKLTPVQGSTATLTVNSSSDRQLLDLAGLIAVDQVRMDIYRDGALYWSGTLDTEGYEEPYTSGYDYDVQLTFSDFGVLNRIKWASVGRESFDTILLRCLKASGIRYGALTRHISTIHAYGSGAINWANLTLDNGNFYDEEGEAMTTLAVLEAILRPFAMRVIQRAGNLLLYDLNAAAALTPEDVSWSGSDAAISHDVVYNNARVTFSPYANDTILSGETIVKQKTGNGLTVKTSYDYHSDETVDGFVIRHGSSVTADGPALSNGAVYFDIDSQYSGSDCAGILWGFKRGDAPLSDGTTQMLNPARSAFDGNGNFVGVPIATVKRKYLNRVSQAYGAWSKHRLRINLNLLFDVRYNPFEEAGDYNEKKNYDRYLQRCRFAYVPVMVTLRDEQGNALYHLQNRRLVESDQKTSRFNYTRWVAGEGTPGCMWLAYYDQTDRRGKTGLGGWATNKRAIGHYLKDLPGSWAKMRDGEYVYLPNAGGYIEMVIYSGLYIYYKSAYTDIYPYVRWVAYKDPSITLVNKNGTAVRIDDQEDAAYINSDAEEEMSVDTIVGTLDVNVPMATGRGLISGMSEPYEKFQRAGVNDRLERLLLGTIYSQYASRKMKLKGPVDLLTGGFVLGDSPRVKGKFLLVADIQNLRADESNMTMTAFGPDEYEGIEYE